MRRIVPMLLALMLISGAGAETVSILCKPGETVNIREKPTTHSSVCGRYECGYTFETDGQTRRDSRGRVWVHMIDARLEVAEAWVCRTYVQYSTVEVQRTYATVDVTGRTALRKAPGGERIKWLAHGAEVEVLAYSGEWAVTTEGYISMECLLFEGGEG